MSSKLHGLVWECDIQPISRKAVLARLADFSSDAGYSWPSVETIRRQIGAKSKNTVTSSIKALVNDGWLEVIPRKSGGRDISNAYQLNVDKIEADANEVREVVKQERLKAKSKFNPSEIDPSNSAPQKLRGQKSHFKGSKFGWGGVNH
ncbi:helix-turn-helix domain-containing protein [Pseudocitrobacter faecalis]